MALGLGAVFASALGSGEEGPGNGYGGGEPGDWEELPWPEDGPWAQGPGWPGPGPYGPSSPDAEASVAAIRAALDTAFDRSATDEEWLSAVDAPVSVGRRLEGLAAVCGDAAVVVEHIDFVSDDAARVSFHFEGEGLVAQGEGISFGGEVERRDGAWRLSRYAIEQVLMTAEPFCT